MSDGPTEVLVYPCGSEIGLELFRALCYSPHFVLHGASSVKDHGAYVYGDRLHRLPPADADDFVLHLNGLIKQLGVRFLFPAHDDIVVRLAELADAGRLGCELLAPNASVCALCRSKSATYRYFQGKTPVPRVYDPSKLDELQYPVFIKPDAGQGSQHTFLAPDAQAARERLRLGSNDIVCQYLPGPEFTIDCFSDRRGLLRYAKPRVRERIADGIAVGSVQTDDARFWKWAESLNNELEFHGAWFFQMRENAAGREHLLEITPRIAVGSGLSRVTGVNLPLLTLYDRLGHDVDILANPLPASHMDKALENKYRLDLEYDIVYVDLDETLLFGDKVNVQAVAFLYQCRNNGKQIRLVTRHVSNPSKELAKHRLEGLFDKVHWLRGMEGKSTVIEPGPAIFIDDSFAERMEVLRERGIPVFEPAAIEALLE